MNLQYATMHTGQFSYGGADRIDITLKTFMKCGGMMGPGCFLVPTASLEFPNYELVGGVKHWQHDQGMTAAAEWMLKYPAISPDEYAAQYKQILRDRYRHNPDYFLSIIMLPGLFFARAETTLCCFCRSGAFCHRHIAKEVLGKIALRHGIALLNGGERVSARAPASLPLPLVVEHLP